MVQHKQRTRVWHDNVLTAFKTKNRGFMTTLLYIYSLWEYRTNEVINILVNCDNGFYSRYYIEVTYK